MRVSMMHNIFGVLHTRERDTNANKRVDYRRLRNDALGVHLFRKLSGTFPDTFDALCSARADDAAPARILPSPSRASGPPAAPSPAVVRDEKSPVSSCGFPEKTNPRVGVQLFRKLSGTFPETSDAPCWARADDAAPALDPAESPRARAPPAEPSPAAGRAEKSPVSSSRAFPEKTNPPGSAFNFSGNFPETPDGVSRDCTDAPEHPRGSTKPPRRRIARFSRVFVPPFPYVVPFFFPSTRR